ncbi:MAG TPA: hypothetical protein DCO79_14990 [Spirochaeta sp.]|nr:hypothetical protein [Spirochaeta sp.]
MNRSIFLTVFISVVFSISVFAQDAGIEKASKLFVDDFTIALRYNTIDEFIDEHSISNADLQLLIDKENLGLGLGPDDPDRFTLMQAHGSMDRMSNNFRKTSINGIGAMNIIDGIRPGDLILKELREQKSYWEPLVVEISMIFEADDSEITISISNLSLVEGRPVLGPSSRIEINGYQPQDILAHYIIEALRAQDADFYAENVLPDEDGLKTLLAANAESGGYQFDELPEGFYDMSREKWIADFEKLIDAGTGKGIVWSAIENIWSGYSASLQGSVYQSSIPFEFSYSETNYRFVLDYCSQLASDPGVFLPGEFDWE